MGNNSNPEVKVNVFALPNQTSILFGLIVAVLLGALWIGSIDAAPIPIWPLALLFSILPFRVFVSRSNKDRVKYGPFSKAEEFHKLNCAIEENAKEIGLKRVPQLWASSQVAGIYARGSFRRWHICINAKLAKELNDQLNSADTASIAEVRILHELYHFKTGDYWQLGLVEDLLSTTFFGMVWAYFFLLGWGFILLLATRSFFPTTLGLLNGSTQLPSGTREILISLLPSAEELMQLQEKVAGIDMRLVLVFISSSILPFILLSGFLWIFCRPKLWRMRESYADAGVVQIQGKIGIFKQALVLSGWKNVESENQVKGSSVGKLWHSLTSKFDFGFLHYSPNAVFRLRAVRKPYLIFDPWLKTAILLGTLTLSLDILLASPLTLMYAGALPMHFTTLVILVTVSLGMLPWLVQGYSIEGIVLRIVSLIMGIRLIWLLPTIGLLFVLYIIAPDILEQFLIIIVSTTAHYAGQQSAGFGDLGEFVFEASVKNLAQIVIIFVILTAALLVIGIAFRRLLTWYSLPHAKHRVMRIAYIIIGWMFSILWLLVLPLSTALLLKPSDLMAPLFWAQFIIGIALMFVGLLVFLQADRQYAKQCPECHQRIEGYYRLGKVCTNNDCRLRLNEWLIADYESSK